MDKVLKDGSKVYVRESVVEDAQILLDYLTIVNSETKNLSREPHEFKLTLEDEIKYLERVQKSNNNCSLLLFKEDELIGCASFDGYGLQRITHRVNMGISIKKAYHNKGAGKILLDALINKAKEYRKTKIELDVRSDNPNAIHLYQKCGFKIEGYREDGFFVDDKYIGLTLMGLNLREEL